MKKLTRILMLLFAGLWQMSSAQTIFVDNESSWSYFDSLAEPPNQDTLDWNDILYNSDSWSTGNAELGYGDGDEATVINNQTETAYFRKSFNVDDPSLFEGIDLSLRYDDGAIVYLNGSEVWRVNMPSGDVNYNTTSASVSNDNTFVTTKIGNVLTEGSNVIAVEVHQASTSSSDLSFDLQVVGKFPGVVRVNRGPYLQKGSNKSMTIRWRTDDPTETIVEYGTSLSDLDRVYKNTLPKREHEVELLGLAPNTKYYYKIKNSAADLVPSSENLYFQTHPNIGTNQPIRMWILGDPGTANNNQRAVRDAYYDYVGDEHTDGILFLGDNAYNDGTDKEYQNALFSNMYEDKLQNSVAWSCLGNHDGHSADANSQTGPYYDIFTFPTEGESGGIASGTESYYSFDYGNIHFIALESYETNRAVGGPMYNWALNDIQNTTQEWIVAFWHHPPYSKGSHNSDTESNLRDMRQNFLPMLESNGVDLVLSGHSHSYERSYLLNGHYGNSNTFDPEVHTVGETGDGDGKADGNGAYAKTVTGEEAGDGAVYITTGSAGKITAAPLDHAAMFYSVAKLGSCVIEVNANKMDVKFIRETGEIEDYFTIDKEKEDCVIGAPCDDNNECTENDVIGEDCGCSGTYLPDPDGDGLCEALDSCPDLNNNLFGKSCDDGNEYTQNDVYLEDCSCKGRIPGTEPQTICVKISSEADDAEEHATNGNVNLNSSDIDMVNVSNQTTGNQFIGLRFTNISVPQGAEIESAYIQFTTDEKKDGPTELDIAGEAVDDSPIFTTSYYNISERVKTSASVTWNPEPWNVVGERGIDQRSPNIASVIQEIVDRPGFAADNAISTIITGTGNRSAEAYNSSPALAAELCISYIPCGDINNDGECDNTSADFLDFSFDEQYGETIIDSVNATITLSVVNGTDVTNLIPSFSLARGAIATVDEVLQESGVTANDFADPLIYKVVGEDKISIQEWTVTVEIASSNIDLMDQDQFSIYPNPVNNQLYIDVKKIGSEGGTLELYDLFGRKLDKHLIQMEGLIKVDVSAYFPGIYFGVIHLDGRNVVFRMMKE
ncbi:metallophosphoesterase [Portibacter lacus]|uniref:T9SS C-terminal target domain-containing protein n=1 Tax=Portibacter lacus TaxID=1099794 RepID=A0AA37WGG7_9BACT|nr:metallophosphoesterase [Portibacter lacus]GLR19872.1 hypothetical protein GCM10007940_44880 [Portibacter lacus]